jgi:EPS-associated MarR family transcriptional regulator
MWRTAPGSDQVCAVSRHPRHGANRPSRTRILVATHKLHHKGHPLNQTAQQAGKAAHNSDRSDEIHFRVLKLLETRPEMTQRELARELGISLGKANYCVKAMLEKGWIKAKNFKNSYNKIAYAYVLTPEGFEKRARMAVRFLKRKMAEFETLKREIEQLRQEVNPSGAPNSPSERNPNNPLPLAETVAKVPSPPGGRGLG